MLQIIITLIFIVLVAIIISCKKLKSPKRRSEEIGFYLKAGKVSRILKVLERIDFWLKSYFNLRLVPLRRKKMIKVCKKSFEETKDIFGDAPNTLKAVKLFTKDIEKEEFSLFGVIFAKQISYTNIEFRKRLANFFRQNPDAVHIKVEKCISILGFPRAGTTLLFNLFAVDQDSRALKYWEISNFGDFTQLPPNEQESRSNNHIRHSQTVTKFNKINQIAPGLFEEFTKSHYTSPTEYEEELLILMQSFVLQLFLVGCPRFRQWFSEPNKSEAYIYLKRYLQYLEFGWKPKSHWVFKAPTHLVFLQDAMKTLPNAKFVVPHRHPNVVIPSICKLFSSLFAILYRDRCFDTRKIGPFVSNLLGSAIQQLIDVNKTPLKSKFYHLSYDDLVKNPIPTMKNLYQKLELHYSDDIEKRILDYLKENPQGKHGRAEYKIEDYGITNDEIEQQFKEYIDIYINKKLY
eukprot:TRINITY_DN3402_c0_g1_i1.p1 TRINITY_DN3402_c0_g1~~TRINITY_DN3402_c0_g1_i1.p1  ORF type:complete len:496 (-),score=168.32 TRINITY_DN3402_c0_g1_i1:72-1454(-)